MVQEILNDDVLHAILVTADELTREARARWEQEKARVENLRFQNRLADDPFPSLNNTVILRDSKPPALFSAIISKDDLKQRVAADYPRFKQSQIEQILGATSEELLERKEGGFVLTPKASKMLGHETVQFVRGMTSHTKNGIELTASGKAAVTALQKLLALEPDAVTEKTREKLGGLVHAAQNSKLAGSWQTRVVETSNQMGSSREDWL